MQKTKLIFIYFLLSVANICLAQNQDDFILLTDSSLMMGIVSIEKDQIKIINSSQNKSQLYSLEQVLSFQKQDNVYEIVKNFAVTYDSNRKKSKDFHIDMGFAKVIIQGTVSLYEFGFYVENDLGDWKIAESKGFFSGCDGPSFRMAPGGNGTMAMLPTGTFANTGPYLVTQYLLKRTGSNEVLAVPSGAYPEKFKEVISGYFADCKELAYKINASTEANEQMEDIINMYNFWVKQHPDAAKLAQQAANNFNGF